jgi:hypothetical protein
MRTQPKPFALVQSTLGIRVEELCEAFDSLAKAHAKATV